MEKLLAEKGYKAKSIQIYEIRDLMEKSGRVVFSAPDIAKLTGKAESIAYVYMSRLVSKGLATRAMKGRIVLGSDSFAIAVQLVEPSYVSLDTALMFHGIIHQVTRDIECATTVNSKYFEKLGIRYHKVNKGMFYGYKKLSRGQSYTMMAEPEKALLDGIYLGIYNIQRAKDYIRSMSISRIMEFLGDYNGYAKDKIDRVIKSSIGRA